ncbi:hypothetical protein PTSG_02394 [Salpingoeca rosetta]|uniref:Tudor domain-containing protein 3 n=1 Tax=Salpingoeca rosetta (strain ATCC 50818 / BSB-021) TaxID=946362 RepID=F2U228_SALR5|nr:uncharacterized protein PTSG_02394 [Salpingoeca rosetta]EGD81680.1 hypothetical protein PTSG_02394 [Salpingoeca rosetta]|eukprot:XP_004996884.1 hypothetical protein PTSG_02394 [Salpingoeca rosetta]
MAFLDSAWHVREDAVTKLGIKTLNDALNTDLKKFGAEVLPPKCDSGQVQSLPGPLVLQVVSVRNIAAPSHDPSNQGAPRMLMVRLTDGHTKATALELQHHPRLSQDTAPGTKIMFPANTIQLDNGFITLTPGTAKVLGGKVTDLYERWKLQRDMRAAGARLDTTGMRSGRPTFRPFSAAAVQEARQRKQRGESAPPPPPSSSNRDASPPAREKLKTDTTLAAFHARSSGAQQQEVKQALVDRSRRQHEERRAERRARRGRRGRGAYDDDEDDGLMSLEEYQRRQQQQGGGGGGVTTTGTGSVGSHAKPSQAARALSPSSPSQAHGRGTGGGVAASPDLVAMLAEMGFELPAATRALQATSNDIEAAISRLTASPSAAPQPQPSPSSSVSSSPHRGRQHGRGGGAGYGQRDGRGGRTGRYGGSSDDDSSSRTGGDGRRGRGGGDGRREHQAPHQRGYRDGGGGREDGDGYGGGRGCGPGRRDEAPARRGRGSGDSGDGRHMGARNVRSERPRGNDGGVPRRREQQQQQPRQQPPKQPPKQQPQQQPRQQQQQQPKQQQQPRQQQQQPRQQQQPPKQQQQQQPKQQQQPPKQQQQQPKQQQQQQSRQQNRSELGVGSACDALFYDDGLVYPAQVVNINPAGDVLVQFEYYNNVQWTQAGHIFPRQPQPPQLMMPQQQQQQPQQQSQQSQKQPKQSQRQPKQSQRQQRQEKGARTTGGGSRFRKGDACLISFEGSTCKATLTSEPKAGHCFVLIQGHERKGGQRVPVNQLQPMP